MGGIAGTTGARTTWLLAESSTRGTLAFWKTKH
jgi:hypothetical protein